MSIARIIALSGIGVACIFLIIIIIQYVINNKKRVNEEDERGEGNQNSTFNDRD